MIRKLPAYPVYLTMSLWWSIAFTTYATVAILYRIQDVGLNAFELVLTGTVLELSAFFFEIPTGVVADTRSRRTSVIIGMFIMGAGWILEGSFPVLSAVLIAQGIWGLGWTFISGAEPAWIADEHGEEGLGRVYLRGEQMHQIGGLIGIAVAVGLAQIALNIPLIVAGVTMAMLGVFLIVCMPESRFRQVSRGDRTTWSSMSDTFLEGLRLVRSSRLLIIIIAIAVVFGAASEGFDRLRGLYLVENISFPEIVSGEDANLALWFGIIDAVILLIGLVAVEFIRRRVDTDSHGTVAKTLLVIDGGVALMALLFGLSGQFGFALAFLWAYLLLRQLHSPLTTTWINQNLKPQVRATVMSMHAQADAFGQMTVGLLFGVIGLAISVRAGIIAVSFVLLPVLLLYLIAIRRGTGK